MSATNAYNTNRLYWTTQFQQYIRFVLQGVQVTIDNTNRLYCRWFKLPPTIQTVCIVIDNTNCLYCSWLAIQTVCIVVGLQYKRFVLSAPQYKPFVLSSMQYKLFVLQLRATIQTVCIAGGSSYHTCYVSPTMYVRGIFCDMSCTLSFLGHWEECWTRNNPPTIFEKQAYLFR